MSHPASRFGLGGLALVVVLTFPGCATDTPFEAKRLETIASIDIARYPTPEIQRHSGGTIVGGGLLLGGFGMEAIAAKSGSELRERCKLEDFGALVTGEFVAQAPLRIPKWPGMRVRESPIEPGYAVKDTLLLSFKPEAVWLYSFGPKGLVASVTATLASPGGEELWRFHSFYSSKEAGRVRELEELEADSCRLLKEEMQHGARVIAEKFVTNLTGQKR
jgi:hypothetical protein